jgi:hypothetical protein
MTALLALALSFPAVIFTVLLAVVLLYWLFVIAGAVHIDALGGGGEGALHLGEGGVDGHLDALGGGAHHVDVGGGDASLAGAAKGAAEGTAEHLHVEDGGGGIMHAVAALRLRSVPATVTVSFIVAFSWLLSVLGMQTFGAHLDGLTGVAVRVGLLLLSPALALPMTSVAIRPLAGFFATRGAAKGRNDLVGKVCVLRTGSVDDKFGEATLDDGGADVVVRVRVDGASSLRRGDQALIVSWDEGREAFTIAPMDEVLAEKRRQS